MATSYSNTTAYAGQWGEEYITAALLSGDTIDQGLVSVKEGIKEKGWTVKRLSTGTLLADSTCDYSPTSSYTLADRKLDVKKLQVNLTVCKEDLEEDWDSENMGDSAFTELPPLFAQEFRDYLLRKISAENESFIWQGSAGAGAYDGFLELMGSDSDVVDVEGVTVTTSNVFAQLQAIYDAITPEMWAQRDQLVISASYNIAMAYQGALAGNQTGGIGANGYLGQSYVGEKPFDFLGVPIFPVAGLPDNSAVCYAVDNLWFGTGVLSDWDGLNIIDTSQTLNDQNVRYAARFYAGVQYGYGSEIVKYEDTTS